MLGGAAALGGVDQFQAAAFVERARVVGDVAEAGVEIVGEPVRAGDPFGQDLEDLMRRGWARALTRRWSITSERSLFRGVAPSMGGGWRPYACTQTLTA